MVFPDMFLKRRPLLHFSWHCTIMHNVLSLHEMHCNWLCYLFVARNVSMLQVRDVRLITCNKTRRFKGIAYVEFRDPESVPLVSFCPDHVLL
jgi:hypothetical protein